MGVFEQYLEFLSIFIGTDDPCSTVGVCVCVCVCACLFVQEKTPI